jgi:arylsulfatase A-like enzyme
MTRSSDFSNTIVLITSDHGEAFGEHGRYGHGWDLSREVLHVPLIIFGPGIPSGLRIPHVARIRDLFATLVDLQGGDSVERRSSLRRFWTPGYVSNPFDETAISEFITATPEFRPALISLITPQWHFVRDSDGHEELYDWEGDPKEQHNLARDLAQATTIGELRSQLVDGIGGSVPPWRGPEYLGALDGPAESFAHHALFALLDRGNTPQLRQRIGDMQAHLAKGSPAHPRRIEPIEEEIIRSLPYQ